MLRSLPLRSAGRRGPRPCPPACPSPGDAGARRRARSRGRGGRGASPRFVDPGRAEAASGFRRQGDRGLPAAAAAGAGKRAGPRPRGGAVGAPRDRVAGRRLRASAGRASGRTGRPPPRYRADDRTPRGASGHGAAPRAGRGCQVTVVPAFGEALRVISTKVPETQMLMIMGTDGIPIEKLVVRPDPNLEAVAARYTTPRRP